MPTPTEVEDALRVLRQDYWDDVRGLGDEAISMVKSHELESAEALREWVDETVDGCQRVIYTREAMLALLFTAHEDAYFEQTGSAEGAVEDGSIAYSKLAYCAMLEDVFDYIRDKGFDPYDDSEWYSDDDETA